MSAATPLSIDASGLDQRALNARVREAAAAGACAIRIENVRGQRYIGTGLPDGVQITLVGTPGNDLACFGAGARIVVRGNAQDGVANTMTSGTVVVHGDAGDVLAYAMRGGRVFVRGSAGYRVGIHMKAFGECSPVVVLGGRARDYLGEYMAGGTLVLLGLGLPEGEPLAGDFVGTGMHGGEILVRGRVEKWQLGKEVGEQPLDGQAWERLSGHLAEFGREFELDTKAFRAEDFTRLVPISHRPYGQIYVY